MTQDVQPLTWQKRTNLEEHQQFFSKINEIIDNLAPTVDEAEQAIAQATAAIASANDAAATANAASAAASAAASQAQTAASTVAGYDSRMTAAESQNTQQDTAIAALQTADAVNVKITGEHAIGNYAVLLTGNQDMTGIKRIMSPYGTNSLVMKGVNTDVTAGVYQGNVPRISFTDKNDVLIATLMGFVVSTGVGELHASVRNADGTYKDVVLAKGD